MHYLKLVMQWLLALLFVGAGVNHFVHADFYANIIPPYLPWHFALVYISGVFEVVLGVLLLVPKVTPLAAWGLIALLIAVFPANIHMALHPDLYPKFGAVVLWVRLPIQGLLIAWAYWFTRRTDAARPVNRP